MGRSATSREERSFGLLVGSVLAAIGTYAWLRGRLPWAAPGLTAGGLALVAAGLLAPRILVLPRRAWMTMAEALGFVMTRVVLAIVFFGAVTPIGLLRRLTGADPLRRRAISAASHWQPYPERRRDPKHYEKMY